MQQTAIQISMINNINNSHNNYGEQQPQRKYQHMGLTDNFFKYKHDRNGRRKLVKSLVWTNEGRQFLLDIIYGKK